MNTTDGGLHFQAGIDTGMWDKDMQKIRNDVEQSMKEIQKQAGLLDESFNKVSGGAAGVEKALKDAGVSFEDLFKGNITENVKNLNLEFGKTGDELRKAAKDADSYVTGMEEGLKQVIDYQHQVLDQISQMPEGEAKVAAVNEFSNITTDIKESAHVVSQLRDLVSGVQKEAQTVSERFRDAREEMERMAAAGQHDTDRYRELADEAVRLKSAQEQVNKEIQAMTQPQGLEGFISGMTFLTSTLGLAQGAMSLFGAESDKMNEIMLRLQALMSVTIGLQELQKQLSAEGAFQINVLSKAKELWALANTRVATALGITNVQATILMGTLTLGLSVAIGAIIYLFDKWNDEAKKTAEEQKAMSKGVADSLAEPIVAYRSLQSQWNALGNDLNAKKKFITDHKDEFGKLGVEVDNVTSAENIFRNSSDAFVEAMKIRAKAAAMTQYAIEKYKKALESENNAVEFGDVVLGKFSGKTRQDLEREKKIQAQRDKEEALRMAEQAAKEQAKAEAEFNRLGVGKKEKPTKGGKPKKGGKPRTAKDVADEYLPPGSVAEIQKRLQAIDEALSKATDGKQIEALKAKRIATAKELADAEEKIATRNFEEQLDFMKKRFELRDKLLEQGIAPEKVKNIFPELDGSNYIVKLKEFRTELQNTVDTGNGSKETAEHLRMVNQRIDEIYQNKSKLEKFNELLDAGKNGKSSSEYMAWLKSQRVSDPESNSPLGIAKNIEIRKRIEQEKKAIENSYRQILEAQKSFEEKSLALQKEYDDIKKTEAYQNGSNADREKVDGAYKKKFGELDAEMIKSTAEWQVAFGDLEGMTNTSLQRILQRLLEFKEKSKGTLSIQDSAELQKAIDRVQQASNKNPFKNLSATFSNYQKSLKDSAKAQEEYNNILAETPNDAKKVQEAGERMIEADKKALEAKKELIGKLSKGQEVFNALGNGIMELSDAFGGLGDAAKEAVADIMAIGNAALDLGKSIVSGDVAGMISSGVKLLASIGKALSGDKKKERSIKSQEQAVRALEVAYKDLDKAIDKALGDKVFDASKDAIENLKKQQAILKKMAETEASKKKSDQGKIQDYNEKIRAAEEAIAEINKGLVDKVMNGIDAKSLADKLSDALVTAFQKGEDSAVAMGKTVETILRDMVINALKMKILEPEMEKVTDLMLKSMGYSEQNTTAQQEALKKQIQEMEAKASGMKDFVGPYHNREKAVLLAQINALKKQLSEAISSESVSGSFDGLTTQERDDIKNMIATASNNYTKALEQYRGLFGSTEETARQGLKGDIKGVSEKTAGALEAQINAMRVNQVSGIEVMRSQLLQLSQIENNTRNLIQIRKDISELNQKTKGQLAGL